MNKKKQGKKNRESGRRFELKVRKDLESKGWIVSKWMNNVEFEEIPDDDGIPSEVTHLIPAKHKFRGKGMPMAIGTGFPDFICFYQSSFCKENIIMGVEAKSKGYLDKEERAKCDWLIKNNIFSRILIAQKGKKRGEIIYENYI